ncbi:hypothetical protein BDD12DRAFT_917070 [Trichophaea hybrida]|nr:hypothetical protein BDD12DRAFT_917070 [Trichophaea hybrida]
MPSIYTLFNVPTPFDPYNRFQTSYILPPSILFFIRALIGIYIFTALIYKLSHDDTINREQSFSYFTNLTYWGLGFYFITSAFHTGVYAKKGVAPLGTWKKPLQLAHTVYYTTVINFPLLVTIVYWSILAPAEKPFLSPYLAWSNISYHALNSSFAGFEIFLTCTERPAWIHLAVLLVILALYLGLAYVTKATEGFYTYSFLDPSKGKGRLVGYVFGIFFGACIIFVIVWLMVWGREWVAGKVGLKPKVAGKRKLVGDEERGGEGQVGEEQVVKRDEEGEEKEGEEGEVGEKKKEGKGEEGEVREK